MNSLALEAAVFAARRRSLQDELTERLAGVIGATFGEGDIENLDKAIETMFREVYESETDKPMRRGSLNRLRTVVRHTLGKAGTDANVHVTALMVSQVIINAATAEAVDAEDELLALEWVTMHDGDVREAHVDAEGQQRMPGENFDVAGHEMPYPGYPLVPLALWINCRCVLRPAQPNADFSSVRTEPLTAGAKDLSENTMAIMAVPAETDLSHERSMEPAHATLIYFGEVTEEDDIAIIKAQTAKIAADAEPFTAEVKEITPLGDEGALVWMLGESDLSGIREGLMSEPRVEQTYDEADITHYDEFTPHVTIGYDVPANGDMIEAVSEVTEITFDRLAVWHGDTQYEYPLGEDMTTTPTETDERPPEVAPEEASAPAEDVVGVPWHGVLAPEGVPSGDGRTFAKGSLTNRDLPLPLTWQKTSAEGHDQSVTVAKIEKLERIDDEIHASGTFLATPEADEVVGLIGEFGKFGVSVDADNAQMDFDEETEQVTFNEARICSASIVAIPAFAEAYVMLGQHPVLDAEEEDPSAEEEIEATGSTEFREVDKDERDRRADDGTAMPDGSYPIGNCEDLGNAIQAIGRAKDPAATKRHIKKRANALDCPDVEIPDGWSAEVTELNVEEKVAAIKAKAETESWADIEQFIDVAPGQTEDGPGWLTHPVDTDRLRDYWVRGPGAAKIGWGTPGDFNRCRVNVAEYVKPQHLNGYCANRHKDALGFWPGEHHSAKDTLELTEVGDAISLVAAGGWCAPSEWFKDPEFTEPCALTVTEEGEVFGHIARWGVCHIGLGGKCTTAPPSNSDYSYFAMGTVDTDAGPVRVGQLTIAKPHADDKMGLRPAAAHYDDTRSVWADVAVGEDDIGIWCHGMVRPGTSEEMVFAAKASGQVSGDWRYCAETDSMELVAALTVNVPGFPTPRPHVSIENGQQVALVAAGMVPKGEPKADDTPVDPKSLASLVVDEFENRAKRRERMAALKNEVKGEDE